MAEVRHGMPDGLPWHMMSDHVRKQLERHILGDLIEYVEAKDATAIKHPNLAPLRNHGELGTLLDNGSLGGIVESGES